MGSGAEWRQRVNAALGIARDGRVDAVTTTKDGRGEMSTMPGPKTGHWKPRRASFTGRGGIRGRGDPTIPGDPGRHDVLPFTVVGGLELGRRDVADRLEQPAMVEPVHPLERCGPSDQLGSDDLDPELAQLARVRATEGEFADHRMARPSGAA